MALVTLDNGQSSAAVAGLTAVYIAELSKQYLPGAPDAVVNSQLTLTLRDFYIKTMGWRAILGPFAVDTGVDNVLLNPVDQNSEVAFVLSAWLFPLNGSNSPTPLHPKNVKIIGTDVATPSTWFMQDPNTMILYPVPDKNYGNILYAHVALKPTPNVAALPDIAFTHHLDAIIDGLLARMLAMPNKPWTDKEEAVSRKKNYEREKLVWRDFAARSYGPSPVETRVPSFAGRGNQLFNYPAGG